MSEDWSSVEDRALDRAARAYDIDRSEEDFLRTTTVFAWARAAIAFEDLGNEILAALRRTVDRLYGRTQ